MLKKAMGALFGALLAISVGAAGAYFTTQVQVADSVIKAGNIAISAEPTSAPLSVDALGPGVPVTRSMSVANTGSLPVNITVSAVKKAGITDFYNALTCRVSCDGTQLYDGPMSTLKTTPMRLASAEKVDLRFDILLPASVSNTLAEDYAKLSLYVDAEQVQ